MGFRPDVAVVAGSGLGGLRELLGDVRGVAYAKIPGFPRSRVVGHANMLYWGIRGGTKVLLFSGRFHMYEGWGTDVAAFPARLAAGLGCRTILVTNAAGGIREDLVPGTLMLISDHINLSGRNPLVAYRGALPLFPSMTDAYSSRLRRCLREVAECEGLAVAEGVYACVLGPSYETPAEVRMLERLGADAVGMSTVPEVVVARQEGMEVAGISLITNRAAGGGEGPSHGEVLEAGRRAAGVLSRLVAGFLERCRAVT